MAKKKKDDAAPLVLFAGGLALFGGLWWLLKPSTAKAAVPGSPGAKPLAGCPSIGDGSISAGQATPGTGRGSVPYAQYLYDHAATVVAQLRNCYDKNSLRAITKQAAAFHGIPAEWVWGVMYTETGGKWRPIGLFGASGNDPAGSSGGVNMAASDYGMSQITLKRYRDEKAMNPTWFPWEHSDLIDPEVAIWATAASYRRALAKKGAGITYKQLGEWWAGTGGNWQRKADTMKQYGPDVNNTDP